MSTQKRTGSPLAPGAGVRPRPRGAAALGALACSPDLGIADLRISVVTMREPDSNWREPRIVVAIYTTPQLSKSLASGPAGPVPGDVVIVNTVPGGPNAAG